uniref:Uncharacterized protein n=1 Tax=Heliothis virescens TaxID=7102 RepID=A0A2A4JSJ0_HELVI
MDGSDEDSENKLLQNALLFTAIRKNNSPEEKIKKIATWLNKGAGINIVDANNLNNTPLHVAVSKGDIEVVKFLLATGASVTCKNSKDQTPLDIAQLTKTSEGKAIVDILSSYVAEKQIQPQKQVTDLMDKMNLQENSKQDAQPSTSKNCQQEDKKANENAQLYYRKRSGTSGLGGQLYETKLLSLILLRTLYDSEIPEFLLGANLAALPKALDDIYLMYKTKDSDKSRYLFLQVQHREDPNKDKVTVDAVLKISGDFSLFRYYLGYTSLSKYLPMESECDIVLFTSANENFAKKKVVNQTGHARFLTTNENGKVFQFDYDQQDIEAFLKVLTVIQAVALMHALCDFILKDNYDHKSMMNDNLIKTYHVFLAQNVIHIEDIHFDINNSYCVGKFRQTFLTSNDDIYFYMRRSLFKDIQQVNNSRKRSNNATIDITTTTFILPIDFGNSNLTVNNTVSENLNRINDICCVLQKLLEKVASENLDYRIVNIYNSTIGSDNILQPEGINGLKALVGNLLIFDEDSKLLKFDITVENLSPVNIEILHRLQNKFGDLSGYRFDINIEDFPKLTLAYNKHTIQTLKEFLDRLTFYTNQPKEDEVENILKKEIDKLFSTKHSPNESLFRIKCDTIYLKVHDQVQKWWKQTQQAPYLTKSCKFFEDAGKDILDIPMLTFLNAVYLENIKNVQALFKQEAVDSLKLTEFFRSGKRILHIISEGTDFSSFKVIQYYENTSFRQNHLMIDLDFVMLKNYFEVFQSELKTSNIWLLTIVSQECEDVNKFINQISIISKQFRGVLIIISPKTFTVNMNGVLAEDIFHVQDIGHTCRDLDTVYRDLVFANRKFVFQGEEVKVKEIIDDESQYFIKTNVLRQMIRNDRIEIGQALTNPSYKTIAQFYINQSLCRNIKFNQKNVDVAGLIVELNPKKSTVTHETTDVIAVTETEEDFKNLCSKYETCNIHWFKCEDKCLVWKRTKGSLNKLVQCVNREFDNNKRIKPIVLSSINEKVVIISAEPGMGKSTFLTHLAIQTKRMYPKRWISKINLLEHIGQFCIWKERKTKIDMEEIIKFLFRVIVNKDKDGRMNKAKNDWENIIAEIRIDDENKISISNSEDTNDLPELDILEINLFQHLYNNNLVVLLFDGFDEISPDYTKEVLQMLCTLKSSKVANVWVTTRSYNVLEQLEVALGTFSFTLQALTKDEQETFLQKIWTAKLGLTDSTKIRENVLNFSKTISFALRDTARSFMSIPLHLYMVSEIFEDFFGYYCDPAIHKVSNIYMQQVMKTFNLIYLYEAFVDMKFFKIRFGEKKHFMCFKDPDIRKMVENERKTFLENHKKVGAYFLLAKPVVADLFSKDEIKEVHEFIDSVKSGEEKSGIVERMVGDDPKFVHLTFAEYFATEFLFDKFQSGTCTPALQKYVINLIFLTDKGGVRRFINSKLIKDKELFDLSTNTSNMCSIFGSLVTQNFLPTNSFFLASEEYLDHIAMYILICTSSVSTDRRGYRELKYLKLFAKKCSTPCDLCARVISRTFRKHIPLLRALRIPPGW